MYPVCICFILRGLMFHICVWAGQRGRYGDSYGVGGLELESRWERDFPHRSRPAVGPTRPPVRCIPGLCPAGKADGGVALATHNHLAPRLKKKYSYTSTPPLGHIFFRVVYFYSRRNHNLEVFVSGRQSNHMNHDIANCCDKILR